MTSDEQLKLWLNGESIHNDDDDGGGECCPDFSCCQPQLKSTAEERRVFVNNPSQRNSMLMVFLGRAIGAMDTDTKVHIAGSTEPGEVKH